MMIKEVISILLSSSSITPSLKDKKNKTYLTSILLSPMATLARGDDDQGRLG